MASSSNTMATGQLPAMATKQPPDQIPETITGRAIINERVEDMLPPGTQDGKHARVPITLRAGGASSKEPTTRHLDWLHPVSLSNMLDNTNITLSLNARYTFEDDEGTHRLLSEGDVERAMNRYLTTYINKILRNAFPGLGICCFSQYTATKSQFDMVWISTILNRQLAILEVKKRGALWLDYFLPLLPNEKWTGHPSMEEEGMGVSATNLWKQASKYSNESPVVIMFDWINTIVWDFAPGLVTYNNGTATPEPRRIKGNSRGPHVQFWFSDGTGGPEGQMMPHRKMILSAILFSMHKQGIFPPN